MKTRFAPSPTGQMHLGNLRTALFSYLVAQQAKGHFLLRIEDTDQARSQTDFTHLLLKDLQWLSLAWQEGPIFQSARHAIYDDYYQKLGPQVYPCFCSPTQLALSRKLQLAASQPPRYAGTCRDLNAGQIATKFAEGVTPALRFAVPVKQAIVFEDLVKGQQQFRSDEIGDFIIRRADGSPAFFFCNAIDDATLGVTHVLRGEDHLSNTPRQILLLQALALPIPAYGHLPLIVGHDGSPLSKRNGSQSVQQLRDQGYLPAALHNYLSRLGHYYKDHQLLTLAHLAQAFSLAHIGKTPGHFDEQQLLHWQKLAVAALDEADMVTWLGEIVTALIPTHQLSAFVNLVKPNILFPADAQQWATILCKSLVLSPAAQVFLRAVPRQFFDDALQAVTAYATDYAAITQLLAKTYRGKALFQPLRMALTGQLQGPELAHILPLLGRDIILQRLQQARDLL